MALRELRSPTFFPFFIITICTICTICNGAALSSQGNCQISNFQLPELRNICNEIEPGSHIVIQPLQSMALTALTISFTARMKKATEYPVIISYAVRGEHDEFRLELPGTATEEAGYYIWIGGNYFGQEHAPFPIDVWTNVTATWNGTNGEYAMYINGEPVIPLTQNDDFKHTLRSGGKLVLGQKQKRRGVESSSEWDQ